MNIYANGFSCAVKRDGSEIVLNLLQESPALDESGHVSGVKVENVGSYVLSQECARSLAEHLNNLFSAP